MSYGFESQIDATVHVMAGTLVAIFPLILAFVVVGVIRLGDYVGLLNIDVPQSDNEEYKENLSFLTIVLVLFVATTQAWMYYHDAMFPFQTYFSSFIIAYLILWKRYGFESNDQDPMRYAKEVLNE